MENKIKTNNPKILKILKLVHPLKWRKLSSMGKNKWITCEDYPTYEQLVEISEVFNIPFGYLFLKKLPIRKLLFNYLRSLYK